MQFHLSFSQSIITSFFIAMVFYLKEKMKNLSLTFFWTNYSALVQKILDCTFKQCTFSVAPQKQLQSK